MKKLIIALVAGVAVFGAVFASAATLGLTTDDLGAGNHVVASCDTSVGVTYQTEYRANAPVPTPAAYFVKSITLTHLDQGACDNQQISATLSGNSTNNSLIELHQLCCNPHTGTDGSEVILLGASDNIPAEEVYGIHVVITGP